MLKMLQSNMEVEFKVKKSFVEYENGIKERYRFANFGNGDDCGRISQ